MKVLAIQPFMRKIDKTVWPEEFLNVSNFYLGRSY